MLGSGSGFDGFNSFFVSNICFDPTGETMAVSTMNGAVLILDATRETTIDSHLTRSHKSPVTRVQFMATNKVISESEDGAMLVSNATVGMARWEYPLFQWSVRDRAKSERAGKYMIREEGNRLLVDQVCFSPDEVAVAGSHLHALDAKTVAFFLAPSAISSLHCHHGQIAVGCANGEVLLLRAPWLVAP